MRRLLPLVFPLLFLILGLLFIPYPGVQNDEVIFVRALFDPKSAWYHVPVFGHELPMLYLTYLGALKSWVWAPIFRVFRPTAWSIRLPALLLGAVTVWLVFVLLQRIHSRRAAWIAAALLATDSCFLLTTCFDWGPVMLQHLLLTLAMVATIRFHDEGRAVWLAVAFFCAGLAFWDKALAVWMLSGMAVGLLILFPRQLRSMLSWRRAGIAAAAFVVGAFPLLLYNATNGWITFRSNVHLDSAHLGDKLLAMRATLDGSGLFGYLVNDPTAPNPRPPATPIERISAAVHDLAGDCPGNWMLPVYIVGVLLLVAFRKSSRLVLFFVVTFVIAWLQMLFNKETGGSAHHTILLWPIPAIVAGVAFADAPFRRVVAIAIGLVVAGNLLNVNQYLYQYARFGPGPLWTDAINAVWADVSRMPGTKFYALDWDIDLPLSALSRTRLPIILASGWFQGDSLTPQQRAGALGYVSRPDAFFILHTPDKEVFPHVNENLDSVAAQGGYRRDKVYDWRDRNGRPTFLGIRFARAK